MAVNTKHRRKLVHQGNEFVWWVAENDDGFGMILHVISQDKSFVAHYLLEQKEKERKLRAKTGGSLRWLYDCPCFDPQGIATPGGTTQLIDWCLAVEKKADPNP